MTRKPKSKHKGLVPKQKTKVAVKILAGRNFRSLGAELPVPGGTSGLAGRNFWSQSDLRAVRRFGWKSGPKSFEFKKKLALEAVGRWGNFRSTPKKSFYWSKTRKNSTNREIQPMPI
jgi:hypothetical protein